MRPIRSAGRSMPAGSVGRRRRGGRRAGEASGLSRLAADERDPVGASTRRHGRGPAGRRSTTGSATITLGHRRQRHDRRRRRHPAGPRRGDRRRTARRPRRARPAPRRGRPAHRLRRDEPAPRPDAAPPRPTGHRRARRPPEVADLDAAPRPLRRPARARRRGRDERDTPGAGAAGGTAFGLLSIGDQFRSLRLVPGVDVVMDETGLRDKLAGADLVITGEGRDRRPDRVRQDRAGRRPARPPAGVACIAVGGGVDEAGEAVSAARAPASSRSGAPVSIEAAMAAGTPPVARAAPAWPVAAADPGARPGRHEPVRSGAMFGGLPTSAWRSLTVGLRFVTSAGTSARLPSAPPGQRVEVLRRVLVPIF